MIDSKEAIEAKRQAVKNEFAETEKKRNELLNQGRIVQTQVNNLNIILVRLEGKYEVLSEMLGLTNDGKGVKSAKAA